MALTMAAQSYGVDVDIKSVFRLALDMGLTKKGEIFSSTAMCALASLIQMKSILLDDGFNDAIVLVKHIISGKMLLIPYVCIRQIKNNSNSFFISLTNGFL